MLSKKICTVDFLESGTRTVRMSGKLMGTWLQHYVLDLSWQKRKGRRRTLYETPDASLSSENFPIFIQALFQIMACLQVEGSLRDLKAGFDAVFSLETVVISVGKHANQTFFFSRCFVENGCAWISTCNSTPRFRGKIQLSNAIFCEHTIYDHLSMIFWVSFVISIPSRDLRVFRPKTHPRTIIRQ